LGRPSGKKKNNEKVLPAGRKGMNGERPVFADDQ
jgi:hypothetical protein